MARICVPVGRSVSTAIENACDGWSLTTGRAGKLLGLIEPNNCLICSSVALGSRSPTTTRIALFGAYQVSWNDLSIEALVASKDGRVPSASCS